MSDHSQAILKEPSLDELLAEPMIQQLMKRDGVHLREMKFQLHRIHQPQQSSGFRRF